MDRYIRIVNLIYADIGRQREAQIRFNMYDLRRTNHELYFAKIFFPHQKRKPVIGKSSVNLTRNRAFLNCPGNVDQQLIRFLVSEYVIDQLKIMDIRADHQIPFSRMKLECLFCLFIKIFFVI